MRLKLLPSILFVVLATTFLYQQISLRNVPVPDAVMWQGDETWLLREFKTQFATGRFRYPEALGSTLAIGSGLLFNNMWLTAVVYGGPLQVFNGSLTTTGRMISVAIAIVVLWLLYLAARRFGIDHAYALGVLILLVETDSFTYASHSGRYDVITGAAVLAGFLAVIQSLRGDERFDYLLGALIPACFIVTPHVFLCLGVTIMAAIIFRAYRSTVYSLVRSSIGGLGMAAAILLLYSVTGNHDWSLTGPSVLRHTLPSSAGYFPLLEKIGVRHAVAEAGRRIETLRHYAQPMSALAVVLLAAAFALRLKWRDLFAPMEFKVGLLIVVTFFLFETHDVRSLIYISPVLALGLMALLEKLGARSHQAIVGLMLLILVITLPIYYVRGQAASRMGNTIVASSMAAYDTVRQYVGAQSGRTLIDSHGMTYLLEASELHPMADIFAWHPADEEEFGEVLTRYDVRTVVRIRAYKSDYNTAYRRGLDEYLDAHTTEVKRFIGPFSDYRVLYHSGEKEGMDTIKVATLP